MFRIGIYSFKEIFGCQIYAKHRYLMALWSYKRVIIPKITYAAVTWWDDMNIALASSELEWLQKAHMYYDHRGNENNSNKSAEDVLGSANTGNGSGVCSTDGSIPSTGTKSEKPKARSTRCVVRICDASCVMIRVSCV